MYRASDATAGEAVEGCHFGIRAHFTGREVIKLQSAQCGHPTQCHVHL